MTVQVIPVRTTGPVQTEWTDSTAAAQQDIMEHNVKQVTISKFIFLHILGVLISFYVVWGGFNLKLLLKRKMISFLAEVVYIAVIVAKRYIEHKRY